MAHRRAPSYDRSIVEYVKHGMQKSGQSAGKHLKFIIVGGMAGGAFCAARLRRLDENAEIIMVAQAVHFIRQLRPRFHGGKKGGRLEP